MKSLSHSKIVELKRFAAKIRIESLKQLAEVGIGHVGGVMSIADVIAVLYGAVMKYDVNNPSWVERDKLVVSKGHAGPALYSALALKGFLPMEELQTLNKLGTNLPSHCDRTRTKGIDMTTGSLGQGLSAALGIAYGDRMNKKNSWVYCILGDGECAEGQIWEAAVFATFKKMSNVITFIDLNGKQVDGRTKDVLDLGDLGKKFESFGWHVQDIDGHDVEAIYNATLHAKAQNNRPSLIVLHTIKGKGCKFAESLEFNHNMPVTKDEAWGAIEILEQEIKNLA